MNTFMVTGRAQAPATANTRRDAHENPSLFDAIMGADDARFAALLFLLGGAEATTMLRDAQRAWQRA